MWRLGCLSFVLWVVVSAPVCLRPSAPLDVFVYSNGHSLAVDYSLFRFAEILCTGNPVASKTCLLLPGSLCGIV